MGDNSLQVLPLRLTQITVSHFLTNKEKCKRFKSLTSMKFSSEIVLGAPAVTNKVIKYIGKE